MKIAKVKSPWVEVAAVVLVAAVPDWGPLFFADDDELLPFLGIFRAVKNYGKFSDFRLWQLNNGDYQEVSGRFTVHS